MTHSDMDDIGISFIRENSSYYFDYSEYEYNIKTGKLYYIAEGICDEEIGTFFKKNELKDVLESLGIY